MGLIYALLAGVVFGLGGLWNLPLQEAFGRNQTEAAELTSWMFLGLAIGCPLFGLLADRTGWGRSLTSHRLPQYERHSVANHICINTMALASCCWLLFLFGLIGFSKWTHFSIGLHRCESSSSGHNSCSSKLPWSPWGRDLLVFTWINHCID